jgi:peroxiredoxin
VAGSDRIEVRLQASVVTPRKVRNSYSRQGTSHGDTFPSRNAVQNHLTVVAPATQAPPQPSQLIPDFRLSTNEGREFAISGFRGRRNLLLIFAATAVPPIVAELSRLTSELAEEETQVLVIARRPLKGLEGDFPVLIDKDGAVCRRFGAENGPAVYITDQYGEIYSAARSQHAEPLPDGKEILASLQHINAACPE